MEKITGGPWWRCGNCGRRFELPLFEVVWTTRSDAVGRPAVGVGTLEALRECAAFHAESAESPLGCFAEGAKFEAAPALKEAEAALELGEEDGAPRLGELVSYLIDVAKAVEEDLDDRSPGQITVDELADECDYDPQDFEGRGDSLIEYKDALEGRLMVMIDEVGKAVSQIYQLASEVPFVIGADPRPQVMLLNRMERIANIAEDRRPDEDWPAGKNAFDAPGEGVEPPVWTVIGIYCENLQRFAESFRAVDAEAAERDARDWAREQEPGQVYIAAVLRGEPTIAL